MAAVHDTSYFNIQDVKEKNSEEKLIKTVRFEKDYVLSNYLR